MEDILKSSHQKQGRERIFNKETNYLPEELKLRDTYTASKEFKDDLGQSYWKCSSCNDKKNFSYPELCHNCIKEQQSKFLCVKCGRFNEEHKIFSTGEVVCRCCYEELYGAHAIVISIQELTESIKDLLIKIEEIETNKYNSKVKIEKEIDELLEQNRIDNAKEDFKELP